MKKIYLLILLMLVWASMIKAQEREYPARFVDGYHLNAYDSMYLMSLPVISLPEELRANPLPPVVDNSELPYLRPVFNQSGSSCGQACLVGYNFTYEMDRHRDVNADSLENQYPTHFVYNFMSGGDGWFGVSYFHSMEVLRLCGTMNVVDYGGSYFDNGRRWINGYDVYYRGMFNRINGGYSINTSTEEGLLTLKNWVHNHLDGSETGGVASFYANTPWNAKQLNDTTPEGGRFVITAWTPDATHAMTIVGYNDSIRYDYNQDGAYTNHLDINEDGIVDPRDWEIGGVKFVNSHGLVQDSGFCYMMYKVLAETFENGGVWNQSVHILDIKDNYQPRLTYKISLKHNSREKIRVRAGVSQDIDAGMPEHIMEFPIFNFQGGNYYMQGLDTAQYLKTIEFGLDVTPLYSFIEPNKPARFFLLVDEKDPNNNGTGELIAFSLIDYTGIPEEITYAEAPRPLKENGLTLASVVHETQIDKPRITTGSLPPFTTDVPYSVQLTATDGLAPYTWDLQQGYDVSAHTREYQPVEETRLLPNPENESIVPVALPFDFPFYGHNYDTVYLNEDGFLQFTTDQLPWPYLLDYSLHLRDNRIIAPLAQEEFIVELENNDGAWFQGNEDHATFTWHLSLNGNIYTSRYEFSVTLYPSGEISFNYGSASISSFSWVSGISNGDKHNFHFSPVEDLEAFNHEMAITFKPYPYPTGMSISRDGLFSGTPSDGSVISDIHFQVSDNQNLSATRTLQFSSGPVINFNIHGGTDNDIDYGDTVVIDAIIHNRSASTITGATMSLDAGDPYLETIKSFSFLGNIPPGDSMVKPACFSFYVSQETPDRHGLWLKTNLQSDNGTWEKDILDQVNAPVMNIMNWEIIDGNDGILESGEAANLVITLINEGHSDMTGVTGQMNVLYQVIELVSGSELSFGTLHKGHMAYDTVSIRAMDNIPSGLEVPIRMFTTSDQMISRTDTLNLQIGKKPVLVIDMDPHYHTGPIIFDILQGIGMISDYQTYIPDRLDRYQSVFLCLGYYNSNYELSWAEGNTLAHYLDDGGRIYMEGRKTWRDDVKTPVHDRFNIQAAGFPFWTNNLGGLDSTFMEGIIMTNGATQPFSLYYLDPIPPAYTLFADTSNHFSAGVAFNNGTYRTIGTVFELGSLEDSENPSTKLEALLRILDFFEVDYSLTDVPDLPSFQPSMPVSVFPNPFKNILNIEITGEESGTIELAIYNQLGQLAGSGIKSKKMAGTHHFSLDVSDLAPGMYFCVIKHKDNYYSRKVIKY